MSKDKITRATFIVAIYTLLGNGIGFVAQVMMAKYFGVTQTMDAFIVASSIPTIIYGILTGILMSVFVLVFTQYRNTYGLDNAWKFASNMFNLSLPFFIFISFMTVIFASPIVKMLAPGFETESLRLTIKLVRLLSVSIVFVGLTGLTSSILYSQGYFAVPTLLNSIMGLSVILLILFLRIRFGIFSLAIGMVVGSFTALLAQVWALRKNGAKYQLVINLKEPFLKKIIFLSFPVLLTSVFFYLNRLVTQMIASNLAEGNIAILNYAFNLISIPALFFAGSISTAIFPSLTQYATEDNWERLKSTLQSSIKMVSFILIPLTFGIIILRQPLVRILFQRGMFDKQATSATASALSFYAIGLLAYGLDPIISRTFYALDKMKIHTFLVFILLLINLSLSLILVNRYSYNGLAIATSISYIVVVSISYFILRANFRDWQDMVVFKSLIKIIIASLSMGMILFLTLNLFNPIISILVAGLSYLLISQLLKNEELNTIAFTVKRYLKL